MRLTDAIAVAPRNVRVFEVGAFLASDELYCATCRAPAGSRTLIHAETDRRDLGGLVVVCDSCRELVAALAYTYWRPTRAQA